MLLRVAEVALIAFTEIVLGQGGLPACSQCRPERPIRMRSVADVASDVGEAVASWGHGPGPNVALAAAEAFLHPELPAIVGHARESGVRRLMITTGGEALSVGDNAAGSLDAGVRQVELVLLAGEPQFHDGLTGRPGTFEAACSGARAFRTAAATRGCEVNLAGRVPACVHNAQQVAAAVGVLGGLGCSTVAVELGESDGFLPDASWLASVADTGMVNRAWVWFPDLRADAAAAVAHRVAPWARSGSGT